MNPVLHALRDLYRPSASESLASLEDATQGISNAAAELRRNPTPDGCERLATWLEGARRTAARLAHELAHESTPERSGNG